MEITIDMIRKAAEGSNRMQREQMEEWSKTPTNPYGFFWGF